MYINLKFPRKSNFAITILILLLTLFGCNNRTNVKSLLIQADTIMNKYPDSSLKIIKSINPKDISRSAIRAKYNLLYSKALDKNYIDLTNDSIIRYAADYYRKKGTPLEKATTYYYLGRIYYNAKNTEQAIRMLYEALEYASLTTDYYLLAIINNTLGNLYYYQRSYDEAAKMFISTANYFGKIGEIRKKANALSYIGKSYSLILDDSSATKYYQQAKEIYIQLKDTAKILMVNNGIAISTINNIKQAESILKNGYVEYNNNNVPLADYSIWARIYMAKNDLSKAKKYALTALNESILKKEINLSIPLILRNIELKSNNYKKAYEYSIMYSDHNASAFYKEKSQLIQEIKERYDKDKLQASYIVLQEAHKYQKIIYGLVITLLLFLSGFIILWLITKRKNMQEKFNRELSESTIYIENLRENFSAMENKYKQLNSQNNKKSTQTNNFLMMFEQRLILMKEILEVAYTSEGNPIRFYNKFKEYINISTKTENAFGDLQYIVNEKYFGIIDHVKDNYPTLNRADLEFFSMLCFGFSSNAIRLIYGHTNLDSVFTKRKKLREKLLLQSNIQIETFIKNLQKELQKNNTF